MFSLCGACVGLADAGERAHLRLALLCAVREANPLAFNEDAAAEIEEGYRVHANHARGLLHATANATFHDKQAEVERFRDAVLAVDRARPAFVPFVQCLKSARVCSAS